MLAEFLTKGPALGRPHSVFEPVPLYVYKGSFVNKSSRYLLDLNVCQKPVLPG